VVALLRQWQADHKQECSFTTTTSSSADSRLERHAKALKALLQQGVNPSNIPLEIFPQSKAVAKLMLRDCSRDDLDDEDLFEDGEMDDYLATDEQKKVFLAHWASEGLQAAHLKVQQSYEGDGYGGNDSTAAGSGRRGKSKASGLKIAKMRRSLLDQPEGLQVSSNLVRAARVKNGN
jgi:hypothetical protein